MFLEKFTLGHAVLIQLLKCKRSFLDAKDSATWSAW